MHSGKFIVGNAAKTLLTVAAVGFLATPAHAGDIKSKSQMQAQQIQGSDLKTNKKMEGVQNPGAEQTTGAVMTEQPNPREQTGLSKPKR